MFCQNEHFMAIVDHKVGGHYFDILAELNKCGFSAAPHLCQGWAEVDHRQGRRSVSTKDEDAHSRHGTTLWIPSELLKRCLLLHKLRLADFVLSTAATLHIFAPKFHYFFVRCLSDDACMTIIQLLLFTSQLILKVINNHIIANVQRTSNL